MTESSSTIAFYFAIVAAVLGLMTLPFGWADLNWGQFSLLALAALLVTFSGMSRKGNVKS